jgi:methyl-accepting chemotaxis protein
MKSIGLRLAVIMLCVIMVGTIVTVGTASYISGRAIARESLDSVFSETKYQTSIMNEWLASHKSAITAIAASVASVRDNSDAQFQAIFNSALSSNAIYSDVYMGFPDNTAIMGSGFPIYELYDTWKATERGWYKLALTDTNNPLITSPYVDTMTGDLCITVVHAVKRGGEVVGVVGIDILITVLSNVTLSVDLDGNGYAMLLDKNGDILVHPNADYSPYKDTDGEYKYRNINTVMGGTYSNMWKYASSSDGVFNHKDAESTASYFTSGTLNATGWHLVTVLPARVVSQPIRNVILIIVPITIAILLISAFLIYMLIRNIITRPIAILVREANSLAAGDTNIQIDCHYSGEIGTLAQTFQRMTDSINAQVQAAKAIADGDLTTNVSIRGERDVMGKALQNLLDNLRLIVSNISDVAGQVAKDSDTLSLDSDALTRDTDAEIRAIDKLTENADALSADIRGNAELASQAAELSEMVKLSAEKGSEQMEHMMQAVKEINEASKSIEKVMKVIDDIAFQTNILALNAAVEAARAGQHGKGFAVVAEEVRSLASKSADAAKDTGSLITNSMEKAELGSRIATETSESLRGIVEGINKNTEIVSKIARSGAHQSESVISINKSIRRMSKAIQHSNESVHESAEVSKEMGEQAIALENLILQFNLGNSKSPRRPGLPGR